MSEVIVRCDKCNQGHPEHMDIKFGMCIDCVVKIWGGDREVLDELQQG